MPQVDVQHCQETAAKCTTLPVLRRSGGRRAIRPQAATLLLIGLALFSLGAGPGVLRSGHERPLRLSAGEAAAILDQHAGPAIDAAAAVLVDRQSETVVWDQNADAVLAPASTTKLMTALTAMETLTPEQVLEVPVEALVGGTSMGLEADERVRVWALLHGALLPSGNDAAMTLALGAAGSEAAFAQRMNANAAKWNLAETRFVNPHGLDAEGHVSSARDLASLGLRALKDPLLAGIVAKSQASIDGYRLVNTNELLDAYPGAYGVKTGTTDNAGQVLVAAARGGTGDVLSVVMNSPDRYAETRTLLDFYFDHWRSVDTRQGSDVLSLVHAPDGAAYVAQTAAKPLLMERWQANNLFYFREVSFDKQGQPTGSLQVWSGPEMLAEDPMTFTPLPPATSSETE